MDCAVVFAENEQAIGQEIRQIAYEQTVDPCTNDQILHDRSDFFSFPIYYFDVHNHFAYRLPSQTDEHPLDEYDGYHAYDGCCHTSNDDALLRFGVACVHLNGIEHDQERHCHESPVQDFREEAILWCCEFCHGFMVRFLCSPCKIFACASMRNYGLVGFCRRW